MEYFLIALEERISHYKELKFLKVFNAIESREDPLDVVANYGLTVDLQPADDGTDGWVKYYKEFPGGYGCYISHYFLWEQIMSYPEDTWCCILEDDASVEDVDAFYKSQFSPDPGLDLINLNWRGINGSEAYIIKPSTAGKLVDYCKGAIIAPVDKLLFFLFINECDIKFEQMSCIGQASWSLESACRQNSKSNLTSADS